MLIPVRKLRYLALMLTCIGIGYSVILISAIISPIGGGSGINSVTMDELDPFQNPANQHNQQQHQTDSKMEDEKAALARKQAELSAIKDRKIRNNNLDFEDIPEDRNLPIPPKGEDLKTGHNEVHQVRQHTESFASNNNNRVEDAKESVLNNNNNNGENTNNLPKPDVNVEHEQLHLNTAGIEAALESKPVEVDETGKLIDNANVVDVNKETNLEKNPDREIDNNNNNNNNYNNNYNDNNKNNNNNNNMDSAIRRPIVEKHILDNQNQNNKKFPAKKDIQNPEKHFADLKHEATEAEEKIPGKPADLNNPWFDYKDLKDKYDKSNEIVQLPPDGQFDKDDHDDKSGEEEPLVNQEEGHRGDQNERPGEVQEPGQEKPITNDGDDDDDDDGEINLVNNEKIDTNNRHKNNNNNVETDTGTDIAANVGGHHDNSPMVNENADERHKFAKNGKGAAPNGDDEGSFLFRKWRSFGIDDPVPDLNHILKVEPDQPWENINCDEFLYDRASNYRNYLIYKRLSLQPLNDKWMTDQAMDCDSFKKQYHFPDKPYTQEEAEFPLAYAMLFHHQIEQVVNLLRAVYWPQNYYCIHIDQSATQSFKQALNQVASCFPNIYFVESLKIEWGSFEILQAAVNCLEVLRRYPDWRYVQILSNSDYPLRTNREMVEIFKVLNGSNDCSLQDPEVKRFATLQENKSKVRTIPPFGITIYQGGFQASLTHEFVDFITTDPKTLKYYGWLKDTRIADEFFWGSVMFNIHLGAPGSFPGNCLAYYDLMRVYKPFISRYQIWRYFPIDQSMFKQCRSRRFTNWSCVFGIKDIPILIEKPHLFLHKVYYNYQPITLYCLTEWYHNQTYGLNNYGYKLDMDYYRNLPHVLYHNLQNKTDFKCGL